MCIDGAIAVSSYSSADKRLPIEIGIATATNTLNVVIGPMPGIIELHPEDEQSAGLSSLEMEAVGVAPHRACELINDFLLGKLRTSCPSAGNGRFGDAEKPDFQSLIIG